jgi:hypothetical protein
LPDPPLAARSNPQATCRLLRGVAVGIGLRLVVLELAFVGVAVKLARRRLLFRLRGLCPV